MKLPSFRFGQRRSIRARVLTIVLIPSAAMLILGVGAAGFLIRQGLEAQNWAVNVQEGTGPGIRFIEEVEEERRLSLLRLGGDVAGSAKLDQQRREVDAALVALNAHGDRLLALDPNALKGANEAFLKVFAGLPTMREDVDARKALPTDAYTLYNQLAEIVGIGLQGVARTAPDTSTAIEETVAGQLFAALDSMSRSNALAAGGVSAGKLTADELQEYRSQVGAYHVQLDQLGSQLSGEASAAYQALVAGPAWQRLVAAEKAVINGGKPAVSVADWQSSAVEVTDALIRIWSEHHNFAQEAAKDNGRTTFVNSLVAGIVVLVVAIAAFLVALRLSNRLIKRLERLRAETLELADEGLPRIVARLHAGDSVDPDTEVPLLNHGVDEVGQVADAFNKAHRAAVLATTREAKTREGMNAVFLNIARRSQVVVHRQLEVLDEAERTQENPAHLELLFQLDHLATRARRNAENLVILGGERPGRKWRNPVPLEEIARSAVSETEGFARVRTVRLPEVAIEGGLVADLMHLLAELVDNAISFSPPDSPVHVRGNFVGKGVVVEVEDQGLGIAKDERERLNTILHNPPDFEVMALAERMHLGLFVVAQLAARHDIVVTLTDSAFGGIHAVVLIPSALIVTGLENGNGGTSQRVVAAETLGRPRERRLRIPVQQTAASEPEPAVHWPAEEPRAESTWVAPVEQSTGPGKHSGGVDGRRPLPRRRRQENLAPQLLAEMAPAEATVPPGATRSPARARDTMSAFLRGTEQARSTRPPRD